MLLHPAQLEQVTRTGSLGVDARVQGLAGQICDQRSAALRRPQTWTVIPLRPAHYEPLAAQLEFECAAGQSITQNIPLVNSGMKPMSVTANFAGQREYFAGYGRDMVVDGKKKADFPLTFRPARPGTFLAKLVLKTGGESISYALKGVANEPLAQGHVVIDADARGRTRHRFTVPNVFGAEREAAYEVSSDLNFVGGDPQCVVRPNATSTYDMGVAPTCSGVFHGSSSKCVNQ